MNILLQIENKNPRLLLAIARTSRESKRRANANNNVSHRWLQVEDQI